MNLVDFQEKYPNYNKATDKTATEKLVGYKMSFLLDAGKLYQSFSIPKGDYIELITHLKNCKPGYKIEMDINDATFCVFLRGFAVLGYCTQTKERIAVNDAWITRFIIKENPNSEAFWHEALK